MNYSEPVSFWEPSGFHTHQEFINAYVVEGKFHHKVPKDVIDSFSTVSYLLAYAYYKYEFLDEAITKTLVIVEMAIKLKAKQLNISLDNPPTKKGVIRIKNLGKLMDEVLEASNLNFYKEGFHRARNIRNRNVHPSENTFMGVVGMPKQNLYLFVNLLNLLFLSKEVIQELNLKQNSITNGLLNFEKKLLVLNKDNKRYLIYQLSNFQHITTNHIEYTVLVCVPVLDLSKLKLQECNAKPIVLELRSIDFKKDEIIGVTLNNEKVKIEYNTKPENEQTYLNFKKAIENEDHKVQFLYENEIGNKTDWTLQEMIYNNCWDVKE